MLKVVISDTSAVIVIPRYGKKIFEPMNIKIIDSAGFKYVNWFTAAANKKYSALRPKIAKILLV